jgi:hypothetical protein
VTTFASTTARLGRDEIPEAAALRRLEALSRLLDGAVRLPIPGRPAVGLDAAIGLVPVVGDLVGAGVSLFLVSEAWRHGAPREKLVRMLRNAAVDAAVGSLPLVGDVFDVFFRANRRNIAILREHLAAKGRIIDIEPRNRP